MNRPSWSVTVIGRLTTFTSTRIVLPGSVPASWGNAGTAHSSGSRQRLHPVRMPPLFYTTALASHPGAPWRQTRPAVLSGGGVQRCTMRAALRRRAMQEFLDWAVPGSDEWRLARQLEPHRLPKHIAVIMDGNGRWARKRLLPRAAGHRAGVKPVREIIEACCRLNIETLTLYAFSVENWKRPKAGDRNALDAAAPVPPARAAGTESERGAIPDNRQDFRPAAGGLRRYRQRDRGDLGERRDASQHRAQLQRQVRDHRGGQRLAAPGATEQGAAAD